MNSRKKKKRKKGKIKEGFTLIEILAAVTILGLLSIVAIVSVNKVIQKSKQNHYLTAEDNLKIAGQSYVQQNRNSLPKTIGQKKQISLKTLVEKNYIEPIKDYNDNECDLDNSYVQIFKYSQDDYSYMAYLDCPVYNSKEQLQKIAPNVEVKLSEAGSTKTAKAEIIISSQEKLLSWSYIVYQNGKEVLNSGSMMVSNYDKNISKNLNLSKYTPGKIKVVVTATNIYGQTTTATSQTINYKDEQAPTCIIKEVDKETNPKPWTQENRTITVGCDDGEGSGCTREEYTKTFKSTTDVGKITIEDKSGNKTTCKVSVNVDVTPPSCEVEFTGTKGENGWYKTKDVKITLKPIDAHSGVGSYDLTTSATPSYNNKNSGTQSDTDGITWYGYVKDKVGNVNMCDNTLKVDTTKPTCKILLSGTSGNNGWYKSIPVTLTLKPMDNLSGVNQTGLSTSSNPTLGNKTTDTQGDIENVTWYGKVKDNAGNISEVCNSGSFKVDTTKPTCSVSFSGTNGNNGWYKSTNASVSLSTNDNLSKVDKIGLTTGGTSYNGKNSDSQGDTAGQTWNGYVMDKAGNENSCNSSVKVDTQAPSCTISLSGTSGNNGWYKSNAVSVTLNPTDSGPSGVGKTGLSTESSPSLGSKTSDSQGDTAGVTWYGRVQDNAGNISSTCNSGNFKVDATTPSIAWDTSEGPHNNSNGITVYTSCSDSLSGVASHTRSSSVSSPTTGTTKTHSCTDNAGNSTSTSRTFKVKTWGRHSSCGVELYKSCAHSECGIEEYNECEDSTCGVKNYKTCAKAICGNKTCRTAACGEECKTTSSVTSYAQCGGWTGSWGPYSTTCTRFATQSEVTDSYQTSCIFHATSVLCYGGSASSCRRMDAKTCTICTENQYKSCAHKDCGYKECETASCGVKTYKTCAAPNCGVKTYKTCRTSGCGIERYKECWHY